MSFQKAREFSAAVDAGLKSCFRSLGVFVTTRPLLTIIAVVVFSFALLPGMIIGKKEQDGDKLWVPQDTTSQDQQKWVQSIFGDGERRARAYSGGHGVNLLTRDALLSLEKLQSGLINTTADCKAGACDGKTISYTDVKAKQQSSILSIWGDVAPSAGADILADVNNEAKWFSSNGDKLKISDILGGIQYDTNGKVIKAEAFLTTFWLKNDREEVEAKDVDPATDAWELAFDDYVNGFSDSSLSANYAWTKKGQSETGGDAIRGDVGMLSFGYVLLIGFSVVVMSHYRQVQSNGVMALASLLSIGLSIISTFGICGYLGVKQNPVTSTLYLVLLGIGVDDAYVIIGDYSRTQGSPIERVIQALTKAGTSIAVTSVTDIVAFAAGISSSLPALRDFCIFAAFGIFFDFVFQCTFFIAILLYRAKGTADNRPDWLCCYQVDPESTGYCDCNAPVCSREGRHVCCPCSWETKTEEEPLAEAGDSKDARWPARCPEEADVGERPIIPLRNSSLGRDRSSGITRKALNSVVDITLSPLGAAIVLCCTLGVLGGAIGGLPKLKTDFDIKWFTPDSSAYKDVYDFQEKYFPTGGGLPVYVFTKSGNYAAAHSDGSLVDLYARSASCEWVDRSISNWYTEFAADAGRSARSKASEAAFVSEVNAFVTSAEGARFKKDLAFETNSDGVVSGIRASRAMYLMKESKSGADDIAMAKSIRSCVHDKPLGAFPFAAPFLFFDGLDVVDKETIQNVLIACLCVFLVNLVMLADFFAALLVLLMIGLVDICILGYMAHWNVDFNSVTAVNLVLAVGLAVDYSAHIAHSFLVSRGSGIDRAKKAIDEIGASVFNGAFSTFLAVLPLGLSKSYVFTVFFKMWFMIIIFGTYFGIIVLPILLWLAAPLVGSQEEPTGDGIAKELGALPRESIEKINGNRTSNAEETTKSNPAVDTIGRQSNAAAVSKSNTVIDTEGRQSIGA